MLISDDAPTLHDIVMLYGEDYAGAMNDYPIWDEGKREWLNTRIYEHFAFRRIAQDTPAMHLFFVRRTMHEMMPAINPMFRALDQEFDILDGHDYTDSSSNRQNAKSAARQLFSDTPQTQLSGAENYATTLTENDGENGSEGASTSHSVGRSDGVGERLTAWASSVNNALYLVFDGLEPCYNQVWDDYSTNEGVGFWL